MTEDEEDDIWDAFVCREVTLLKGGYKNQYSLRQIFKYNEKIYQVKAKKVYEETDEIICPLEHTFKLAWRGVYDNIEIKELKA
jgi:hypothetical protein